MLPPSIEYVKGATPDDGVTVTVPLLTPGQEVAVDAALPEIPGPAVIVTDTVAEQPLTSVSTRLCKPLATPVKMGETCDGPPSIEKVYGAVPVTGITVMVPLLAPGQEAFVDVVVPAMFVPDVMVTVLVPVQLLLSFIVMVYVPGARPVKILLAWKGLAPIAYV